MKEESKFDLLREMGGEQGRKEGRKEGRTVASILARAKQTGHPAAPPHKAEGREGRERQLGSDEPIGDEMKECDSG